MEERAVITQGAPTSTGGTVLEGHSFDITAGAPTTTVGMKASCGVCGGSGVITPIQPIPVTVEGQQVALEGDVVACLCPFGSNTVVANQTIHYVGGPAFGKSATAPPVSFVTSSAVTDQPNAKSPATEQASEEKAAEKTAIKSNDKTQPAVQEAEVAFFQVEKSQGKEAFFNKLFTAETQSEDKTRLLALNSHLNNPVRAGELVILTTEGELSAENAKELHNLKEEAQAASTALNEYSPEEANTLLTFRDVLDEYLVEGLKQGLPSNAITYTGAALASLSTGSTTHLKAINSTIQEINKLYVDFAQKSQVLGKSSIAFKNEKSRFYPNRNKLFNQLDTSLGKLSSRVIEAPQYHAIKHRLKLYTSSVLHNAKEISQKGSVPNLGKKMANIASASKAMRGVGYLGLAVGAIDSADTIYQACNEEENGQCARVATVEVGGFAGGWFGSYVGGIAAGTLVVGLGVASAPVSVPALVIVTVSGGLVGGVIGTTGGKGAGELGYIIYEWFNKMYEWSSE